jgi:hypothetical protein
MVFRKFSNLFKVEKAKRALHRWISYVHPHPLIHFDPLPFFTDLEMRRNGYYNEPVGVKQTDEVYPTIEIGNIEDGYFCFETVDNHGYVYLEEYEKDGKTPKDYGITLENLGDQVSYFNDKDHISCLEIDGSDPEFIDHVTDDILSTILDAVIADRDGKLVMKKQSQHSWIDGCRHAD